MLGADAAARARPTRSKQAGASRDAVDPDADDTTIDDDLATAIAASLATAGGGGSGSRPKKAKTADAQHPIDASGVLQAAKDGSFAKFAALVKSQTYLSFEDFNSLPPGRTFGVLHQIAFHGSSAALQALLTAHPRVDLKMLSKDGKTAEEVAVEEGADASFLGFLRECVRRQSMQVHL
jgi:hypothetical protein